MTPEYIIHSRLSQEMWSRVDDAEGLKSMMSYHGSAIDDSVRDSIRSTMISEYGYSDLDEPYMVERPPTNEGEVMEVVTVLCLRSAYVNYDVIKSTIVN